MTPEHMKTTPEDIDLDRMKDDTISRQAVLKLLSTIPAEEAITKAMLIQSVKQMDAAQPSGPDNLVKDSQGLAKDLVNDCISRKAAIEAIKEDKIDLTNPNVVAVFKATGDFEKVETQVMTCDRHIEILKDLPSAQPEKEKAKRVLWKGWKGYWDTRYKCPNCKKPVKNDDIYCHRCGQRLMFPHISFTDYIPGKKQETIVRWDDE